VTRIEINDIRPPTGPVGSTARQRKAEREKQSVVLAAEGRKSAAVRDAQARDRLTRAAVCVTGAGPWRREAVICPAAAVVPRVDRGGSFKTISTFTPGDSGDLICGLGPGGRVRAAPHTAAMAATEGGFRGAGN
jgi:hypothetical protein